MTIEELVERAQNAERLLRYEIDTDYLAGLFQSLREALESRAFAAAYVPARDLFERDAKISIITTENAKLREALEWVLDHDPKKPGLRFDSYELLLESLMSKPRAALGGEHDK